MKISDINFSISSLALPAVILIGPPGSGKTEVGSVLAKDLGWTFWDTDILIEQAAGLTIPEIFNQYGEKTFRLLEKQLVEQIAHLPKADSQKENKTSGRLNATGTISDPTFTPEQGTVISTGGGLPVPEENFAALTKIGSLVYLYAQVDVLFERTNRKVDRPLLTGQKLRLKSLLEERAHIYAKVDFGIDTSNLDVDTVKEHIKTKLQLA